MQSIILSPLVTEKSMNGIKEGKYTFRVAKWADKNQIKKDVKDKFGVDVIDVATINVKERKKMAMRREVTESSYKKAIVRIKSGQKINLFTVEEKGKKK